MEKVIEINNLTKHYDKFSLEKINLDIPKGTIVGSGNFISLYPIDKLSDYGLDKA